MKRNENLEIRYLDTCYPDYFQGFSGETIAVMVRNRNPKLWEVKEDIKSTMNNSDYNDNIWNNINHAIDFLFNDLDLRKGLFPHKLDHESIDECYIYFGLVEETVD